MARLFGVLTAVTLLSVALAWSAACASRPSTQPDPAEEGGPGEESREENEETGQSRPLDEDSRPVDESDLGDTDGGNDTTTGDAAEADEGGPFDREPDVHMEDDPVEIDPSEPLWPSTTDEGEEEVMLRIAALQHPFEWPRGMYWIYLRQPEPPVHGDDVLVDVWRLVQRAIYDHTELLDYESVIDDLEFAIDNLPRDHPDVMLIAFNLGAAWQQRILEADSDEDAERARAKAISAFRRVLSTSPSEDAEVEWVNEPFRHYAAVALSQLMIERGDRRRAVNYAYAAAFSHPLRDPFTGRQLPREQRTDVLLPVIYDYAELSIREESSEALEVLLTTARPEMRGRSEGDLLASVLADAMRQLAARSEQEQREESAPEWPQLYTRQAVRTFYERWLTHYPEHERRRAIINLSRDTLLAHDD